MYMGMVAQMLRALSRGLVLAIARSRSPDQLERQQDGKHEGEQAAFHRSAIIAARCAAHPATGVCHALAVWHWYTKEVGSDFRDRARARICFSIVAGRCLGPGKAQGLSRTVAVHNARLRDRSEIIDTNLLKELTIDGQQREDAGRAPRWIWPVVSVAVLSAVLAGAAWWWSQGHKAIPVQTATVAANGSASAANAVLQATGYVTARRQATVSAQITGTLTQVLIEEGDHVRKGQILAHLEDTALRAGLNSAEASARSAQANVEQFRAQLAQAEADARRQAELAASGMSTRQSAEQTATAVKAYAAQVESAQRQADAARAQVAQARVNFDYATVRAPFDGVVTVKAAQVGEIISPLSAGGGFTRTGVGTIVDMDSLEVDVDVNEAYIGQVQADMPCEAVLDAYPDWRIGAHVVAVIPSADRGKATVKVRVALEQKDGRVVPDMGVRVSFLAARPQAQARPEPGVLVPPSALVQQDGASAVFVVQEGRALRRAVSVSKDIGKMKLVSQGLKPGESIVLSPPEGMKDGAAVSVNKDAP